MDGLISRPCRVNFISHVLGEGERPKDPAWTLGSALDVAQSPRNGLMGLRGDVSKGDVVSILLRVRDILQRAGSPEMGRWGDPCAYYILYYIMLYSILFYSILFYYIILHYIIFYYIVLYYIILYYIILYYII